MSATLNMPQLTSLLKAPAVISKGKQYPVDVHYENDIDEFLMAELCARTVIKAAKENEGDILVFLPGQREIHTANEILRKELRNFSIHMLYGALPQRQQAAAILPDRSGKRKVVFWLFFLLNPGVAYAVGLLTSPASGIAKTKHMDSLPIGLAIGVVVYLLIGFIVSKAMKTSKVGHWF